MTLLSVRDLTVSYRVGKKNVRALVDVCLDVDRREIRAIVGESGSGKSTLAAAILRILPPNARIEKGSILFDGIDLVKLPESDLRKIRGSRIGIVFQDPSSALNPVMRIGHHIAELFYVHKKTGWKEGLERAASLLEAFGIARDRIYDYPHQLSGGMKQRVCIAMAVALRPDLVIADEPTTALDVVTQVQVLKFLQELRDQYGSSIMFITHDLSLALSISDSVSVMYSGYVVEEATSDDLLREPLHPYTRMLLRCIPRLGEKIDFKVFADVSIDTPSESGCPFASRCHEAYEKCFKEVPPLVNLGFRRKVRCWRYA